MAGVAEMDALVERLFCSPSGYQKIGVTRELFPSVLYRCELADSDGRPVTLQIYRGISEFGHLWDQEVRLLLRAAALDHPAMPIVVRGGHKTAGELAREGFPAVEGIAYVMTESSEETLFSHPRVLAYMANNQAEAVRQFHLLADALASLHELGFVHRNVWPGTIDMGMDNGMLRLRLARFEMSKLINNLLQADGDDSAVVQLLAGQEPKALDYMAPERLRTLTDRAAGGFEDQKSDAYSLAMMVAEWFTGPLATDFGTASLADDAATVLARARLLNRDIKERVRKAALPKALADLLERMLDFDPKSRRTAGEAVEQISRHYEAMTALQQGASGESAYLIAFKPDEYRQTLLQWEWLTYDPVERQGLRQLTERIQVDLEAAELLHAPDGAVPFTDRGDRDSRAQATTLLLGKQAAWFCRPWRHVDLLDGAQGEATPEVLFIAYVVRRNERFENRFSEYRGAGYSRIIPKVEAVSTDMARLKFDDKRKDRPSWLPLIHAVRPVSNRSPQDIAFEDALDWLLEYQDVVLRAREYAYKIIDSGGKRVRIQFDRERDDKRRLATPLRAKFTGSRRRRPAFADFFRQVENDDGTLDIEVLDDENGNPRRSSNTTRRVIFEEKLTDDAIEVSLVGTTGRLPETGWLRPMGDHGDEVANRRQRQGRWSLARNRVLLRQLQDPLTISLLGDRWQDLEEKNADGPSAKDLIVNQPLYALQGPPGTGKTRTSARAICAYLKRYPTERVLVSAQSNYALDNLALQIVKTLDKDAENDPEAAEHIAIRVVASSAADRVDDRMGRYLLTKQAEQRHQRLVENIRRRLADPQEDPNVRKLLGQWLPDAEQTLPELADRISRGATLVFATCATAASDSITSSGPSGLFDWVLVEEAAKAWPVELAIPLSRGLRWTLVGDHKQLAAHRLDEVIRFLQDCAKDKDPEIRAHGEREEEYTRVFRLFASLFEVGPAPQGMTRPTGTLTRQYRMLEPIGELVSRVFYPRPGVNLAALPVDQPLPPGSLESMRREPSVRLKAPKALAGRPLTWIDTGGLADHGEQPRWFNPGEIRVVRKVIEQLSPAPAPGQHGYSPDPLAILTPYRKQADLLRRDSVTRDYVSTVHAFQGREADVVVVSLVRGPWHGGPASTAARIGHLINPELVNVLFSRARDHLVLVGDLEHFALSGSTMWKRVVEEVYRRGNVVPAVEVIG